MNEETLFHQALDTPVGARGSFLDQACGGDLALRHRVQVLLAAHDNPDSFLQTPPACCGCECEEPETFRPDDAQAEKPGTRLGPYHLLEQIGEGGMGAVFLAEQLEPVQRKVAVKLIKPGMDSRQVIARFEAERQALALMDHPNIARVLDAGTTEGGRPYFVMELVKGVPITRYCDEAKLPPRARLELFVSVCSAVQHAHQKGIIHRDLKPTNVLVGTHDGQPTPKVIDFGVAKATGAKLTERSLCTEFGAVVGTLEYMSPEQAELNQLDVDTRSDIYSLGVLLYELLTGTTPFERQRLKDTPLLESLRLIREEEPPTPSLRLSTSAGLPVLAANRGLEPRRLTSLVKGELDWIVMKALEKDRKRRYETANDLAADVQRYLADDPVQACPPTAGYRMQKFLRRHRRGLATAAALGLGLLLAVGTVAGSVGWVARDRADRLATTQREVDLALEEVVRLLRDGDGPGAQAALRQAEALLTAGEASPERHARVRQWRVDLNLAAKLEEIRLQQAVEKDKGFDLLYADPAYRAVFRLHGLDVDTLEPGEVARRIRDSAVQEQLLAALHDWAWGNIRVGRANWERLIDIARRADTDPWRDRFLEAFLRKDQKVLAKMAQDDKVAGLPPATVLLLARALTQLKNPALAREMCERVQRRHPGDLWLNLEIAYLLQSGPKKEEAISFLRAFLAVRPRSPAAFTSFAFAMAQLGKQAEAEAALHQALRLQPDFPEALGQLGLLRMGQRKLPEAEAYLRRSLEQRPEVCYLQYHLANVRIKQGKLVEAEAPFREAIRLRSEFPWVHFQFADLLSALGKLPEAVASYQTAIKLQPDYAEAHCNLGHVLLRRNDFPEAIKAFRRGHELGSQKKGWSYPSAQWVRNAELTAEIDRWLSAIVQGNTRLRDTVERLAVADRCAKKRLYVAAVRFFAQANACEPGRHEIPGYGHRYNAACWAALAGSGQGTDTARLGEEERAAYRRRALSWLDDELEACRRLLEKDGANATRTVAQRMKHWLNDPDFAHVRGEEALSQLSPAERPGWQRLWQEVEILRQKTTGAASK